MKKYFIHFLGSILFALNLHASINSCENHSSYHLNENYPAKVVFVAGSKYKAEDLKLMILSVFKNQKENSPFFILLGTPLTGTLDWQSEIKNLTDDINLQNFYLSHIKENYIDVTWSQDFFESFYDNQNKSNFIRLVQGYKLNEENHYKDYLKAQDLVSKTLYGILGNNFRVLDPINNTNPLVASKGGHKGGNIESTNEGHCLIGDSDLSETELKSLTSLVCKEEKYVIKLPTSWLPATHVDELVKQLPDRPNSMDCNPRFAIISLKKGLDLLKQHKNDIFWNITTSATESKRWIDWSASLNSICAKIIANETTDSRISKNQINKMEGFDPIIPKAGEFSYRLPFRDNSVDDLYNRCLQIKNEEIITLYEKDDQFSKAIEIFEGKISEAKTLITIKYKETNPSCKVEFIDLPVLMTVEKARYYSNEPKIDVTILRSDLLLPNPINSLQIGNQIFIPNAINTYLENYIETAYKNNGLDPIFLNTFDIHNSGGNIHCSTQTVRYCK